MKTIYVNSFEISHSKEAFCLILKFESPDEHVETVYVTMSPSGAKTMLNLISKEMSDYELEHGEVQPWKIANPTGNPKNSKIYLS